VSPVEAWIDWATLMVSWLLCCLAIGWLVGWRLARSGRPVPAVAGVILGAGVANGLVGWLLSTWWLGRYLQ